MGEAIRAPLVFSIGHRFAGAGHDEGGAVRVLVVSVAGVHGRLLWPGSTVRRRRDPVRFRVPGSYVASVSDGIIELCSFKSS